MMEAWIKDIIITMINLLHNLIRILNAKPKIDVYVIYFDLNTKLFIIYVFIAIVN